MLTTPFLFFWNLADKYASAYDSLYNGYYGSEALKNLEKPSPAYYNFHMKHVSWW